MLAPNAELAAALFAAVEHAHREAGHAVWPTPRIRDFSGWLRERYAARQLANADSPRCLSDLEERELWRSVIDSAESDRDFLDPAAAARASRRARRALREYGIPLQALERHPSTETQTFLAWNRAFEQRCQALRCISADTLLGTLAPPDMPLAYIASPDWRPVARRWLSRSATPIEPLSTGSNHTVQWQSASSAAESAAIADWALSNRRKDPHFRAWVCIPDLQGRRTEVTDALDAALAPQRFDLKVDRGAAPYAAAGGTPLSEYAPVRLGLDSLSASVGAVPFVRFSALLRAPELQDSDAEAGAASLLDVALRRRAPSEADLPAWLDLAERIARTDQLGEVAAVRRLRAAQGVLGEARGPARFSTWVPTWIKALEAGAWALRGRWFSNEFQAAERFRELLASLATADALFGALPREAAQRILMRAARDTAFQPQTGIPAMWITGQLMDPWLNYDGLWVSGLTDRQWPPPPDPLPLIPIQLQRDHGVVSASPDASLDLALQWQRAWQARASHCVFSIAAAQNEGVSRFSPLLTEPSETTPGTGLWMLPRAAAPRPHWHALLGSAPKLERLSDEMAPPFAAGERTRGVATLRAQSRCAFRGFAETRIGAEPLEQPVPGFNDRERGDLTHLALEHIWSVLRDSRTLQALPKHSEGELLEAAARRAIAVVGNRRDPGPRWRARERARLQTLLEKWLDVERARAPFAVESIEQEAQVARLADLDFRVRIDRVDLLEDGARVLLDYKSGSVSSDWHGERPDNPQLPLYALLRPQDLVAVAYGRVNARDAGFVAESERRAVFAPRSSRSSLEGEPDFAALIGVWRARLESLAAAFAGGRAEVAPTLKACRSCHLQGFCRIPAALDDGLESP